MTRIYTRTGDRGETSLGNGARIRKSSARIDLYGDVDELNSVLGVCLAHLPADGAPLLGAVGSALGDVQNQLFELGALLANPTRCAEVAAGREPEPALPTGDLELLIDSLTEGLEPLRNFILPGGAPGAGFLHLARTVCRRVERKAVALGEGEAVPQGAVAYLNRLGDFLFTAARAVNAAQGSPDVPWRPGRSGV